MSDRVFTLKLNNCSEPNHFEGREYFRDHKATLRLGGGGGGHY